MTHIAYDFDGVFIPDFLHIHGKTMLEFYQLTLHCKPIFIPTGPYSVITARDPKFRHILDGWLDTFEQLPENVYHENTNHAEPWLYKIKILSENPQLTTYVESDPIVCDKIRKSLPNLSVIHFDSFISKSILDAQRYLLHTTT
jgi:hypothetical protein